MSVERLRTWLKLPDGPWPPNHYALIGLKAGDGTAEEIEVRVLERLELLRRYQLLHPEEATDGMNLLARALDCLTNPDARRSYDRTLGLASTPEPVEPDDFLNVLFPDVPVLVAATDKVLGESILPESISLPDFEDDVEPDDEPEFEVLPEAILVELAEPSEAAKPVELPQAVVLPEAKWLPEPPPLPGRSSKITTRSRKPAARPRSRARELYADLVRVRKVLRLWERARPLFSDLDRTFNRRTDSIALMGWLAEVRPLLPSVDDLIGKPNQPGNIVAAVARQRLVVDMFRTLLPSQRESLAKDFRAAHYRLAEEYKRLRGKVQQRTEKDWVRSVWNPLLKHLADYPEWFLLFLGFVILMVAVIRSV